MEENLRTSETFTIINVALLDKNDFLRTVMTKRQGGY